MRELFDKALGAYLGLAIGDALGATVEFMRPREIAAQYGQHRDIVGGGWLKLARGQVTDDTTLSLALGGALLRGGTLALRGHADGDDSLLRGIGEAYVQWWRGKPVDCGNTCRRGILRFLHEGTLAGPYNPGDAGNGALMRNLPVALATLGFDPLFQSLSIAQARLTHHHPLSDAATLGLGQLLRQLLG
ncbi:MAG: ADP-ribosylglycohydrolase family protein, partial [Rhodoferax sp.]|nr:ADP-ribosylglycohydrolase family protein [Rhodoferax sp.]